MKTLIIGVGGIGSWLIEEIAKAVNQEQIELENEFYIADDDMVEINQITYQNFTTKEIAESKAKVLAKRFKDIALIYPITKRIMTEKQLEGYNLIICCADNTIVRELVFRYCHKNNIDFIDLRAEGRYVMAMPKGTLEGDLSTLDLEDRASGSCQKESDLRKGWIQKGNKIIAMIGIQMLLNYFRGERNSKMLLRI